MSIASLQKSRPESATTTFGNANACSEPATARMAITKQIELAMATAMLATRRTLNAYDRHGGAIAARFCEVQWGYCQQ